MLAGSRNTAGPEWVRTHHQGDLRIERLSSGEPPAGVHLNSNLVSPRLPWAKPLEATVFNNLARGCVQEVMSVTHTHYWLLGAPIRKTVTTWKQIFHGYFLATLKISDVCWWWWNIHGEINSLQSTLINSLWTFYTRPYITAKCRHVDRFTFLSELSNICIPKPRRLSLIHIIVELPRKPIADWKLCSLPQKWLSPHLFYSWTRPTAATEPPSLFNSLSLENS